MKLTDLKPGQTVWHSGKKYEYQGIKKLPGKIGKVQKIVFQGETKDDQLLYSVTESSRTLENEKISLYQDENDLWIQPIDKKAERALKIGKTVAQRNAIIISSGPPVAKLMIDVKDFREFYGAYIGKFRIGGPAPEMREFTTAKEAKEYAERHHQLLSNIN